MIKNAIWLFVIALFLLVSFLPSYRKLEELRQKNEDYADQIEALKHKNAELVREHERLVSDPVYLEKVARDKMGLIREGEMIYRLTPAGPSK